MTIFVLALAWLQKSPCKDGVWTDNEQYTRLCYSDIIPLFSGRHLDQGDIPYVDHAVEYPVLTGAFMYAASRVSFVYDEYLASSSILPVVNPVESYFDATALLLVLCALVITWSIAVLSGNRKWDAMMFAFSPVLLVHAFTNWDLFAVALVGLALVSWQRKRFLLAGALLGLAISAKFYPILLLFPLFLLCWRSRQWNAFGKTAASTAVSCSMVNVPIALLYNDSWMRFFELNQERPADPDSLWNVLRFITGESLDGQLSPGSAPTVLNLSSAAVFALMLLAIGVLALTARRQPRLAQLLFLTVAGFLLANKVWSPQYTLWLVPLAILARPSWRMLLSWQATEALLWFPRLYWFLGIENGGVEEQWFLYSVILRDIAVFLVCALVVRDILQPEYDLVRRAGADDPAGGVLEQSAGQYDDQWNPVQRRSRHHSRLPQTD